MTQRVEVLGLMISVGSPIQASYLPTPRGLTVVYGLNGAGKTQLLLALQDGLEPRSRSTADCDLVVRVDWSDDPDDHPDWVKDYAANWAELHERVWPTDGVVPELAVEPRELVRRAVLDSLNGSEALAAAAQIPSFDMDLLAVQIADQALFFLEPRGNHIVRIGAQAGDEAPQVASAIEMTRRYNASPGFGDITLEGNNGLWDPMEGQRSASFASAVDLGSDTPPFAGVYDSERPVSRVKVAHVITESDDAPDVQTTLRSLGIPKEKSGFGDEERQVLESIEKVAQGFLDMILLDAPRLELKIGEPRDWLFGRAPVWLATPTSRPNRSLPLSRLSAAERRWSTLAATIGAYVCLQRARVANNGREGQSDLSASLPLFLIIDEPEAHLHRSAEAHMAHGLAQWASLLGAHVVVASHSPELLDLPESNLMSVGLNATLGHSTVQPLGDLRRETMESLGLAPSDLLRRQRGFILVEGLHDQIILEELIGDELRSARIDVLALRGAKQLPATVDSQFLFEYTDAHVIVMLDAIDAQQVQDVWSEATALAETNPDKASQVLRDGLPGNAPELRWMREFLSKAVDRRVHNRLTPCGLQALDIIEYLPAKELVPHASSWLELREEHEASGSGKDFKKWLTAAKRASFSPERLRAAAKTLDTVPDELVAVANLCMNLPGSRRR